MSQQIDKKTTKQVRINAGVHKLLKVKAAENGESIRDVVEGALADVLAVRNVEDLEITAK